MGNSCCKPRRESSTLGARGYLFPFEDRIAEKLTVHREDLEAAARRGHTSEEYAKAIQETNASDEHPHRKFYKNHSLQYLREPIESAVHREDLVAAARKGHTSEERVKAVLDEHPLLKSYEMENSYSSSSVTNRGSDSENEHETPFYDREVLPLVVQNVAASEGHTFEEYGFEKIALPSTVDRQDLDAAARRGHTSEEYARAVQKTNSSAEHPRRKFYETLGLQYLVVVEKLSVHREDLDAAAIKGHTSEEHVKALLDEHPLENSDSYSSVTDRSSDSENEYETPFYDREVLPLAVQDVGATKGHTFEEYAKAVQETNASDEHPLRKFYKTQSLQYLGEENDRVSVPIWIAGYYNSSSELNDVASHWIEHIQRAINDINDAVPGLNLHTVSEKSKARITIAGNKKKSCFTRGSILRNDISEIYLYSGWKSKKTATRKKRASCHELLHALGFGHEHQRQDRDFSVKVMTDGSQYKRLENLYGVTRFDPHSIMLYCEEYLRRRTGDPVWFTKPSHGPNVKMSELDKVGVNNLYRPCKRAGYSPAIGSTGLFYCGRSFGVQYSGHSGRCEPSNGPNCPACRVLKTDRVEALWRKGKWQGWTGGVYCGGRYFGVQEEVCGPDSGPPCPECCNELLTDYTV